MTFNCSSATLVSTKHDSARFAYEALRANEGPPTAGICVRSGTATSCATSNYNSPSELMSKLRETTAGGLDLQSYSDLIARSIVLQNKILAPIPLFAIAGVLFMLSNTAFVMWKRNVKSAAAATERSHRSRRHLRTAGVGAAWVSLAVAVNASTAMHMTTNALAFAAARDYTVTVGSVSTALHWVISGLSLVFAAVITLNLLVAGESGLLAQQAGSYAPLPMSVGPAAGGPTAGAVFRGPSAGLPAGPPGGPRAAGPPAGLAGPRMPGPPGGIARGPPGGGV